MKTKMLELTIFKISSLLQRGYGELGAKTIAENISQNDSMINPLISGKKIYSVFLMCRIRQFTETTESLQEEIIVFVNKIVRILHDCAYRWNGNANKNYGQKYLITWLIPPEAITDFCNYLDNPEVPMSNSELTEIADKALITAIKIQAEVRRAVDLAPYSKHPKLGPKYAYSYKPQLSCGLHTGWAVEGAVGSEFKIDALYLSPHISIVDRLEMLCQDYRTNILVTNDLALLMSKRARSTLRQIDCIQFSAINIGVGTAANKGTPKVGEEEAEVFSGTIKVILLSDLPSIGRLFLRHEI